MTMKIGNCEFIENWNLKINIPEIWLKGVSYINLFRIDSVDSRLRRNDHVEWIKLIDIGYLKT